MATESDFRLQYSHLLAQFRTAFPGIEPPAPVWWAQWLTKYPLEDIQSAIRTLSEHPAKPRFTQESVGRAISASLRQAALARSVLGSGGAK
jgi:hypothetical protein